MTGLPFWHIIVACAPVGKVRIVEYGAGYEAEQNYQSRADFNDAAVGKELFGRRAGKAVRHEPANYFPGFEGADGH